MLSRAQAIEWRRAQRGTVVLTNGVFDLLHPGHIDVIEAARAEGDALIVAVNSDASAARLGKEPDRPICSAADRARVVAALRAVDAVTMFDEDTPRELINALEPDVLVKGGDYVAESLPGAAEVRARGGRVVIVPLTTGKSTTSIVSRIRSPNG